MFVPSVLFFRLSLGLSLLRASVASTASLPAGDRKWNCTLLLPVLLSAALFAPLASHAAPPLVATQHYDNARSGLNYRETILTPSNVNVATFGKLFTIALDANVNGQPLFAPGLKIGSALHNVLFVYASNNADGSPCSLAAFDADDGSALWHTPLPASARWTTATPVIDIKTKTLYVLTKSGDDSGPNQLRAFDLLTGSEKPGSPVTLAASITGTGDGNLHGTLSFDTGHANCRPALLFANNTVYVAFALASESYPYHGWVFAYQYDQTAFTQTAVFCTTPNGTGGGLWQAGKGLTTDNAGNIYCVIANGTFSASNGGNDYGMCVVKLTPTLQVLDWFAPFDEQVRSDADRDAGNVGAVGIRGTNRLFFGATKFGSAFMVHSGNLGKFTFGGPDKVVHRVDGLTGRVGQNPVEYDAYAYKHLYIWPVLNNIQQFQYDTRVSRLNPVGVYKTAVNKDTSGGSLAVTSNGYSAGILWAVSKGAIVYALDASDVSKPELWNSTQNATRDSLPSVGKFQFPLIVNGKAYISTGAASIVVYGLLPK